MMRHPIFVVLLCIARAHTECVDGSFHDCRAGLVQQLFGRSTLPTSPPDYVLPMPSFRMRGLPSPGSGSGVGNVSWSNNLTQLVWTIRGRYITLNATVLYSLNTSSRAPANYKPPPYARGRGPLATSPDAPWGENSSYYPANISDTLLMYHNGHETLSCTPNYDGVVDHFNELGCETAVAGEARCHSPDHAMW